MLNSKPETLLAAVDLGSNSFRLEIGRIEHGQIQRVDYLKEAVRQGGDLDAERNLSQDAIDRGIKCLARFGERLKGFPPIQVRAVATQTLREAKNRDVFVKLAQKALGYPIEVISGVEEARLIYQGVSRLLPQSYERRLVIDIGGRSTEFILGQQFDAMTTDSLRVGSVAWSLKYFADGQLSEVNFNRAEIAAESVLDMIADTYHANHWDVAYGASGTVGAVADVLASAGFAPDCIERAGLAWLKNTLIKAKSNEKLNLPGLKEDRKAVIGGGLAVLTAVFDTLKLEKLMVARGALRHGLLYDMLAEDSEAQDLRSASIKRLGLRFGINMQYAQHVSNVALFFFDAMLGASKTSEAEAYEMQKQRQLLHWAAMSHEIGCAISHSESHKHGAYILENTELMGFAQSELRTISLLVLGHQGKLRKLEVDFENVLFMTSLIALRLAVIFCHSRHMPDLKNIQVKRSDKQILIQTPKTWENEFPQTRYLLEEEYLALQKIDWMLLVNT